MESLVFLTNACAYTMFASLMTCKYYFFQLILRGDARSRKCIVPGSIFNLPPYVVKKSFWIASCFALPTVGIKHRPPAQQASALSINPSPLCGVIELWIVRSLWAESKWLAWLPHNREVLGLNLCYGQSFEETEKQRIFSALITVLSAQLNRDTVFIYFEF